MPLRSICRDVYQGVLPGDLNEDGSAPAIIPSSNPTLEITYHEYFHPIFDDDYWKRGERGLDALKTALDKNPQLAYQRDEMGDTPLFYAGLRGREWIKTVLPHNPNTEDVNADLRTPIYSAVVANDPDAFYTFYEAGANLEHEDCARQTPLELAALEGQFAFLKEVFERGIDSTRLSDEICFQIIENISWFWNDEMLLLSGIRQEDVDSLKDAFSVILQILEERDLRYDPRDNLPNQVLFHSAKISQHFLDTYSTLKPLIRKMETELMLRGLSPLTIHQEKRHGFSTAVNCWVTSNRNKDLKSYYDLDLIKPNMRLWDQSPLWLRLTRLREFDEVFSDPKIVDELDLSLTLPNRSNPLHLLARFGIEVVFEAYKKLDDPTLMRQKDVFGNTPAHHLSEWKEYSKECEFYKKEMGIDLKAVNNKGQTVLDCIKINSRKKNAQPVVHFFDREL